MPTCPFCGAMHGRRSRGGRCPTCNREVYLYDGEWYRDDLNGEPTRFLHIFEKRVAKRLGAPSFRIGDDRSAARMRELGRARQLIGDGDDLEISKEALVLLFEHPKFNWKDRLSLMQVSAPEWAAAKAVAVKRLAEQSEKDAVRHSVHNDVLAAMEDMKL